MSEYQYYEFCKISSPLTAQEKKEMSSLSSRANVGTHSVSYVYNYGDFRGIPKNLLLKYFDVFFYISNWGCIQLMFKFAKPIFGDLNKIKQYCIEDIIHCEEKGKHVLIDINYTNEDGFGWVEGEGMLSDLLPIYEEIQSRNYQFLQLIADFNGIDSARIKTPNFALSEAQEAFFKYADIDHKRFYE